MGNTDNTLYITIEQLRVGLYVHLDLNWTEHPFSFSSFKIKNQDQIDIISGLGLQRIRYDPAKSDSMPLPPAPAAEAAVPTKPTPLPPAEQQTMPPVRTEVPRGKQERIEQLKHIRDEILHVEKQFNLASKTVKGIIGGVARRPERSRHQAEALVDEMVETIISDAGVVMHAMSQAVGEGAYVHSLNVAVLSLMLAKALDLGARDIKHLGLGAVFHDIGKLAIASEVVHKTESLTAEEQALMEHHCYHGADIARKLGLSIRETEIILQHHECFDGSGYPRRLTGDKISLLSTIVAIANAYDNLVNPPNIADALTPYEALSHLFAFKREKFQEAPLRTFIHCLGVYPPGSIVHLSNEMLGLVLSVNTSNSLKPKVLVYDPNIPVDEALIIDMGKEDDLSITQSLRPGQLPREIYAYLSSCKNVTYYLEPNKQNQAK